VIYVRRNPALIPEKVLKVAERAQQQLEQLPPPQRPGFIKKKSHVWRAFARYLAKMSYGKCWYSESPDPHSFFDVDHYRPKLEAKRSSDLTDPGYEWLAFSWDNFRYAAQRSNRISRNEETDENEGKGNWFPVLNGSPKACWDRRCEQTERPVLLDPIKKEDVRLLEALDDGRMGPSRLCIGSARTRVERSIELYGLNLPSLKAARLKVMRDIVELHRILLKTLDAGGLNMDIADMLPVDEQLELLRKMTMPRHPYSKAARAQLAKLGLADLCAQPEEMED
jgi:hypothetical protein